MVHRSTFVWTNRSALPLAASVISASWAVVTSLFALVSWAVGAQAWAQGSLDAASAFLFGAVLLLILSGVMGWVIERPRSTPSAFVRRQMAASGRM